MKRVIPLVLVCGTLVGCASLTAEQQGSVTDIRAFVDETARVYGVPKVYVLVGSDLANIGGSYSRGMITVSTPILRSRHRDALVAHELAHYLLLHDTPLRGATQLDMEREQEERELEANVKAVDVLVRARHLSEAHALSRVYDTILSFYRAVSEEGAIVPPGHRPPCREIADLLGRFPQHRAWTALLECAEGVPARVPVVAASSAPSLPASPWFERAYLSDRLAGSGGARGVEQFHPSRDRAVALVLIPHPSAAPATVVSRWYDGRGIERKRIETRLGDAGGHVVPMWELRPYPGPWVARLSVDDRPAGAFPFTLGSIPDPARRVRLTTSGAAR